MYKRIKLKNGKSKNRHVLVMEEYLGRPLESDEIVHHIDENKKHDELKNLDLCLRKIHSKYHGKKGDHFNISEWNRQNTKGYTHGTYSCYARTKCRCEPCRKAASIYKKAYRKRTGIR
jgi:hypothetical protein